MDATFLSPRFARWPRLGALSSSTVLVGGRSVPPSTTKRLRDQEGITKTILIITVLFTVLSEHLIAVRSWSNGSRYAPDDGHRRICRVRGDASTA